MADPQNITNEPIPEFPWGYGKDAITTMTKDSHWLFVYWEITNEKKDYIRSFIHPDRLQDFSWALKVTNLSNAGNHGNTPMFITVGDETRQWYIHIHQPDAYYFVEYGLLSPQNDFVSALTSNRTYVPRNQISQSWNPYFVNIKDLKQGIHYRKISAEKEPNFPYHDYHYGSEEFFSISSYISHSQYS